MNDQRSERPSLPEEMRHQPAVHDVPKDFFAGASLQLHEIEVLGNVDIAVDEAIRRVGLIKLHQLRLFQVIEEKLHLTLIEDLGGVSVSMVPCETLSDPTLVRIKVEHVVKEVVYGTPDEGEMRVHARQADWAVGKERHKTGGITKHSHVAILHDVGALGALRPDQFGDEPSFKNESLELLFETGDMTIGRPKLQELRRGELRHSQLADTKARDGCVLNPGLRDQKDLRVRIENPHMLDGMAQVTGNGPVMIKEKCELVVQMVAQRRLNCRSIILDLLRIKLSVTAGNAKVGQIPGNMRPPDSLLSIRTGYFRTALRTRFSRCSARNRKVTGRQ